ncbi:MAG TPA: DUF1552 domain-containing protein [Polyangia bacterium]|nr:DUF1552 domain-containing protein [Polyangia bacterium]
MSAPLVITRRSVVKRLAAGTLAAGVAPLLPVLEHKAEAQAGLPKRLLLVYWSGGTAFSNYLPTGTETNWSMSPQMKALEPFKQKITVFANIRRSQDNAKGSHQAGTSGIWTAARMLGSGTGPWVSHPSIDNIINKMVPQQTEIPVFNLDCMSQDPGNLRGNTTYDLECRPVHGEMDPAAAFDRLFTNGIVPPTSGPMTTDPSAGDKLRAQRKSVLDLVRNELQSLQMRLGGQDKKKLEQHLEQLRSAEQRLSLPAGASGGAIPGWRPPTRDQVPKMEYTFKFQDNYPKLVPLHFDMAVAALAADKSRLVTLQLNQGNGDIVYRWIGVNTPHHALTHAGDQNAGLGAIQRWYYERFAELLMRMDSIKEGNGTLLDNTLVVIGNEFVSATAHDTDPWPVFIAGSGGGRFKTGRYVQFPAVGGGGRLFPNDPVTQTNAPFHTQFLTSICHYMGAMVPRVGDPSCGPAGPLPQFT